MELVTLLILLFISGLIVGALARLIVPDTGGMGIFATALAGIGGSFIAGLLSWYVIAPKSGLAALLLSVVCAALLVFLMRPRRRIGY